MDVDVAALEEELFVEFVLLAEVFVFELGLGLLFRCDSLGI